MSQLPTTRKRDEGLTSERAIARKARQFAPIVWLVGKVQSGKTSIIRALTQATDAEIGSGFRACTRTARVFDFPPEAPIIRFLDTRGLGEASYDSSADIAFNENRAHLILAVVKALDLEQGQTLEVIRQARDRHPEWPVLVAQTTLHEGYPAGAGHMMPYPFRDGELPSGLPDALARYLAYQRNQSRRCPAKGRKSLCHRLHANRRRLRPLDTAARRW